MFEEIRNVFYQAFRELDAFSIPGVGTFRKQVLPARIDHLNQQILPPTLGFALVPDTVPVRSLEDFFLRNLKVTVAKATELVESVREYFNRETEDGGAVEIPEVGKVVQKEGKFELLDQTGDKLQDPNFFGLGPITFSLGSRQADTPVRTKEEAIVSALRSHNGVKTEAPKPIVRKKRKALPVVLLLLLAIGVSGFVFRREVKQWMVSAGMIGGPADTLMADANGKVALHGQPSNLDAHHGTSGPDSAMGEVNPVLTERSNPPKEEKPKTEVKPPVQEKLKVEPKVEAKPPVQEKPKTEPKVQPKEITPEKNPTPPVNQANIGIQPQAGVFYLVVASTQNPTEASQLAASQSVKTTLLAPYGGVGFYKISVFESKDKSKVIQKMVEWKTKFNKSWIYWLGM